MDQPDNFEKKIKAKLEEVNTPYDDSAWQNFMPFLDVPGVVFWKRWYMPYLFSGLLFLLAIALYPDNDRQLLPARQETAETGAIIDTVFRRDTVLIVDTVYVYKKVYINEQTTLERLRGSGFGDGDANGQRPVSEEFAADAASIDPRSGNADFSPAIVEDKILGVIGSDTAIPDTVFADLPDIDVDATVPKSFGQATPPTQKSEKVTSNKPVEGLMSPPVTEDSLFKSEREFVSGDTSNLRETFVVKRSKPAINAEATLSFLLPISGRIEYQQAFAQGINVGLEWRSGIGVYLGAIRNRVHGDIDDDGIDLFGPALINAFPNLPDDITTIDDIYLTNTKWFFPLELRWRSAYYSGFSFESSLGLLGNYLVRSDLKYEFEDRLDKDDQEETVYVNQFKMSHIKLGVGTNYLFSRRMGMFLRSHYWMPISRTGLIGDRMHGLEIGVGFSYFLRK